MSAVQSGIRQSAIESMPAGVGRGRQPVPRRGVVVVSTVPGDKDRPGGFVRRQGYVSVLTYGRRPRFAVLHDVLVTVSRGSIDGGDIWSPRAATVDLDLSKPIDVRRINIAALDGDHVIVDFLDGDWSTPYISNYLPHPNRDRGRGGKPLGKRLTPRADDAGKRDVDYRNHKGVVSGVDFNGTYVIDTTAAHTGDLNPDGTSPIPNAGDVLIRIRAGQKFELQLGTGRKLTFVEQNGRLEIDAGALVLKRQGDVAAVSVDATGKVTLGDPGAGTQQPVARTTDAVLVDPQPFIAGVQAVIAATTAGTPIATLPSPVTGKITGGSAMVGSE